MTINETLNNIIALKLKDYEIYSKQCKVLSVDETERTCYLEPLDGTADVENVRLQASLNMTTGIVLIPAIDSVVIATFISNELAFISTFTTLTKILIDTDLVQFNGGANGGIVIVESLVEKLNKLEQEMNNLKTVFTNWVVVPTDGGLALKTAITAGWLLTPIPETTNADIEDTLITH